MMNSPASAYSTPIKGANNNKRPIQPSATVPAKKRIQFNSLGYVLPPAPPASVARRNARERNRVKQVNMGFAVLRQHIPTDFCELASNSGGSGAGSGRSSSGGSNSNSKSRKVSKVDTLRCAVEYIRSLQDLLDAGTDCVMSTTSSSAMSTTSCENMSPPPHQSHLMVASTNGISISSSSSNYGGYGVMGGGAPSLSPSNYSDDASSPTPSDCYGSEHSYFTSASSTYSAAHHQPANWVNQHHHHHHHAGGNMTSTSAVAINGAINNLNGAFEVYEAPDFDASESIETPNEDELLDAISWWQQSQ